MERKICSKCKEEKEVCEFQKNSHSKDGYRSECSLCSKNRKKLIPKEKILNYAKNYREKNKELIRERQRKYYHICSQNNENLKKIKKEKPIRTKKTKEEIKIKRQEWIRKNREIINEKKRTKYKEDVFYKLSFNVRNRLNTYLKSVNIRKKNKTFEIIGCSPLELKIHLETQFTNGMDWNNHGVNGWHIDHKIPLSTAKNEDEFFKLSHYTNLQPLWSQDNLKKSNKIL
jgi:hypothetical protein